MDKLFIVMTLISCKLKIISPVEDTEELDPEDKAVKKQLKSLGIGTEADVAPEQVVSYEPWLLNSHVLQSALSVGKFKKEIFITFVGGWMLACLYEKKTYEAILSIVGQ